MIDNQKNYTNMAGEPCDLASYCMEMFSTLNDIQERQTSLSHKIAVLPTFTGDSLKTKGDEVRTTLVTDSESINTLHIVEAPETAALEATKAQIFDILTQNKSAYNTFIQENRVRQIESELKTITESLKLISGDDIKNFSRLYSSTDEFSSKVLKKLEALQEKLTKVPEGEKKTALVKSILNTKSEADKIYRIMQQMEHIRNKDINGFIDDIFSQMTKGGPFGGGTNKKTDQ